MLSKVIYNTKATAVGGREGHVRSDDGAIDMNLVVPKAMGGPGSAGANPETLFACGYAACFESATRMVASKSGHKPGEGSYVTAEVDIGPREQGGYQLAVHLTVHLAGLTKEQAEQAAKTAHQEICPYSHATRGNVDVDITVV